LNLAWPQPVEGWTTAKGWTYIGTGTLGTVIINIGMSEKSQEKTGLMANVMGPSKDGRVPKCLPPNINSVRSASRNCEIRTWADE
jgi:hypothetical protein